MESGDSTKDEPLDIDLCCSVAKGGLYYLVEQRLSQLEPIVGIPWTDMNRQKYHRMG